MENERLEFAIKQLEKHNIEYQVKNESNGHLHCRRKCDDMLMQYWANTGTIMNHKLKGIHNFIKLCEEITNDT